MTAEDLKNSILQLAVEGKLVPQDPSDEPASVLLKKIRAEKQKMITEGKIKKEKHESQIIRRDDSFYEKIDGEEQCIDDEIPFEIPESWEWVRLGEYAEKVTDQVASGSFASLRANVPSLKEPDFAIMVKTADFSNDFTKNLTYTTEHGYNFLNNSNLFGGELILSNIGSIGKCFIVPKLNQKMTLAPNCVMIRLVYDELRDYLYNFILSPQGFKELIQITSGTAMKKFNKTDLKTILLPIPPIQEQIRIVEKINKICPLIEEYVAKEKELSQLQTALPVNLKNSVLHEAVQGKLVPQDPGDEPASVLLKKIRAEKQKMAAEGKIKKEKHESQIVRHGDSYFEKIDGEEQCIDDEIPFEIPDTWEWVRVKNIAIVNPRNFANDQLDAAFMPMSLLNRGYSSHYSYETKKWGTIKKDYTHFATGDIVIAKITPCFQNRKSAIISELPNGIGAGTTELHVVRNITDKVNKYYLLYIFKTQHFIESGVKVFTGTAGQQRISKDFIEDFLIPLPPLAEQQRIVDKIEEIMTHINSLQV